MPCSCCAEISVGTVYVCAGVALGWGVPSSVLLVVEQPEASTAAATSPANAILSI
jgi:hypothetical protein